MLELSGKTILISASAAPSIHVRDLEFAVASLSRSLAKRGATIAYGGNLDPKGFTELIAKRVSSVNVEGKPQKFIHVLDEPSLTGAGFRRLHNVLRRRNSNITTFACVGTDYGQVTIDGVDRIRFLPKRNQEIVYSAKSFPSTISSDPTEAFSFARRIKIAMCDACIAIGGKTGIVGHPGDRYFGRLPGVAEEAIGMLDAGKPVIALGAYGGCSQAISGALGLGDALSEEEPRQPGYAEAVETLKGLVYRIPADVHTLLKDAARARVDNTLIDTVSTILRRWGDHRPGGKTVAYTSGS